MSSFGTKRKARKIRVDEDDDHDTTSSPSTTEIKITTTCMFPYSPNVPIADIPNLADHVS